MWTRFIDAHLHLQDSRYGDQVDLVIDKARKSGVCSMFCNASKEKDWPIILDLSAQYPWIIPFLGIHPWYAQTTTKDWETRLYDSLSLCEYGAGIGETGLDKARPQEFEQQIALLEVHLDIALDLGLPVSLHCVRCWGKLIEILERRAALYKLPTVMIHSFNGSLESMKRLTRLGCYISFSSWIADPEHIKLRETFLETPLELVLLETDAPDQINPALADQEDLITSYNEPTLITAIYRAAAYQRGLHIENFAEQIWQNATVFANRALIR
ncbi:MAG: TatD family deoxyribonuclease [Desulfobulbaceae bacterium]|nr:MAG: TatD family deoxyribonuclease [Desulfobulbaceae bacterium]